MDAQTREPLGAGLDGVQHGHRFPVGQRDDEVIVVGDVVEHVVGRTGPRVRRHPVRASRRTATHLFTMTEPAGPPEPIPAVDPVAASMVTLRDGSRVAVVPMQPTDSVRLMRFHATLSPETTYSRFFSVHPELSSKELHRFTHVDHHDREAIVALADDEIVAVARFDLLNATDAEVAFVVADGWQGRGSARSSSAASPAGPPRSGSSASSPTAGRAGGSARSSSAASPAGPPRSGSSASSPTRCRPTSAC
ncbi:MAG: hypothetical protein WKF43_12580 [Acidimicrobiales bacterium]